MTITNSILRKSSGSIHIKTNRSLSLVERKLSNILLKHAYHDLLTKDKHEISVQELMDSVGWGTSENVMHLKKALKKLCSTVFEFNILKRDKRKIWMCTSLINKVIIEDGICTYVYDTHMRELLYQPRLYARIDLLVSNQFKNKYSLTLWEYFREYIDTITNESVIQTDWISIDSLIQDYLQLENTKILFKDLNRKYIKPILKEINELSDISVSEEFKRRVRTITHIRFKVVKKPSYQPALDINMPMKTVEEEEKQDEIRDKSDKELVYDWEQANPEELYLIEMYADIQKPNNRGAYIYTIKKDIVKGKIKIEDIKSSVNAYEKKQQLLEELSKADEELKKQNKLIQKQVEEKDQKEKEYSQKIEQEQAAFLEKMPHGEYTELENQALKMNPNIDPKSEFGAKMLKVKIYELASSKK